MSGGRAAADYTRCPSCGHRTVLFHFGRGGEDYLACSYRRKDADSCWRDCGWECYRWPDRYDTETDRRERAAWERVNGAALSE